MRTSRTSRIGPFLSPLLLVLLACPSEPTTPVREGPGPYEARIRWTSYGIPHIEAADWGSLGYGMGYAFARDNLCVLADQIVMVRSERARFFGPGPEGLHLDSDFGWLHLGVMAEAERSFTSLPAAVQENFVGYVSGYNRYLDEVGVDGVGADCAGADWVRPITEIELLAYYLSFGEAGSGAPLLGLLATAQPPNAARIPPPPADPMEAFREVREPQLGSNGWGIGRDLSETGRGMLLSNTHFPANGNRRWWESQLTIPGVANVYGVSLMGVAAINIGFTENFAWTHTVSGAQRFTGYQLELDPSDPTVYLYDGEPRAMTEHDYSIEVLQPDGSLASEERTLWRSHYGPMLNAPLVGWTTTTAFTFRDANAANLEMAETWWQMNIATDLASFQEAHEIGGIPWVHTMYADAEGNAWYIDSSAVPNLSAAQEAAYEDFLGESFFARQFADSGVTMLNGSDSSFEWIEEAGSRVPGLVPVADAPSLLRSDFVANANDNHWATNPAAPLTGFPLLYGAEETPRSPRTRMNLRYLMEGAAGPITGPDGLFSLDELEQAALTARSGTAQDLRAAIAARCDGAGPVTVELEDESREVDIGPACGLLNGWDGRYRPESVGAIVFRELLGSGVFEWEDFLDAGLLYASPFDPADPVWTPSELAPADDQGDADPVLTALGTAVVRLEEAGIALDTPLGEVQYLRRGEDRFAFTGAQEIEGTIAIARYSGGDDTLLPVPERAPVVNGVTDLTEDGYEVNGGNSFILTVAFGDEGPSARAVTTYSQASDPDSPHFSDQSAVYAEPSLRPVAFTEAEIAADTVEELTLVLE